MGRGKRKGERRGVEANGKRGGKEGDREEKGRKGSLDRVADCLRPALID